MWMNVHSVFARTSFVEAFANLFRIHSVVLCPWGRTGPKDCPGRENLRYTHLRQTADCIRFMTFDVQSLLLFWMMLSIVLSSSVLSESMQFFCWEYVPLCPRQPRTLFSVQKCRCWSAEIHSPSNHPRPPLPTLWIKSSEQAF